MSQLVLSGILLTSFLGGTVSLLAPCCVSVMLPAYFATGFHRGRQMLAMTVVFGVGVGTIILPNGLGASFISRFLIGEHLWVFAFGGAAMVIAGFAMIVGWKFSLPMLAMRPNSDRGVGAVYSLGVFSGAASACCAPVIAGVAALAGASASFPVALAIGVSYVFGMVAPLALLALVWDKRDWGSSRLFTSWKLTLRLGRWKRTVPAASFMAGSLLAIMGMFTVVLALNGPNMQLSGWQLSMSAWLQHVAAVIVHRLNWLPGWVATLLVVVPLAALVIAAAHPRRSGRDGDSASSEPTATSDEDSCCPSSTPTTNSKMTTSSSAKERINR